MKTPAALAALAALAMTAAGGALDYAYRLPAEIQTPGPQALPELTWQQGSTPLIRVDVLARGRPVDADTNTTVRMIIGQTATNLYYVVASNSVTTGTSYYVQWPTVGTNSAGAAWWYTIYFERSGHRYWTGNGDLYIEPTTSTAEDGLTWQTVTAGYAVWGTITGSITSQADLVATLAGYATGTPVYVESDPHFTTSVAASVTADNTNAWTTAIADLGSVSGSVDTVIADMGSVSGAVDTLTADFGAVSNAFTNHQANGDTDILHLTAAEKAIATNPPGLALWADYNASSNIRWVVSVDTNVVTNLVVTGSLTPDVTGTYVQIGTNNEGIVWTNTINAASIYKLAALWGIYQGYSMWNTGVQDSPTGQYFVAVSATGTATVAYSIITNSVTNTISISGLSGTHFAISTNTTVSGTVTATAFSVSGTSVFHAATITTGAAPALVTNDGVLGITVHEQRPLGTGATDAYPGDAGLAASNLAYVASTNAEAARVTATNAEAVADAAFPGASGTDVSNRIVALESPYQAWSVLDPGEGETATVAVAHGGLVSITATNGLTTIAFDNAGYGTQGVSRVGVELWAGTNAIGFDSATITNPTAPTISTDAWNSLFFRRTADNALWEGRQ